MHHRYPQPAGQSQHISVSIERPPNEVYDYVADPANLPVWASGLGDSIEEVDGRWIADSPMGRVEVRFAERNDYGVLDHEVTSEDGEAFDNPMRVIAAGSGSELVFTPRRGPGMSDEQFADDGETVQADLEELKRLLEKQAA